MREKVVEETTAQLQTIHEEKEGELRKEIERLQVRFLEFKKTTMKARVFEAIRA